MNHFEKKINEGVEEAPKNEKKAFRKKGIAQDKPFVSTAEKAQYEVFTNGTIPRETIGKWIKNDIEACLSFLHSVRSDDKLMEKLVDHFYERYVKMHQEELMKDDDESK